MWWMCETELRLSSSILPASLMWPRDGCLNQRSFCFYAEMWALSSAGLCCLCFDPPLSLFWIFSASLSLLLHLEHAFFLPNSSPVAALLIPTFLFCFLLSACYLDSCIFYLFSSGCVWNRPLVPYFQCKITEENNIFPCLFSVLLRSASIKHIDTNTYLWF